MDLGYGAAVGDADDVADELAAHFPGDHVHAGGQLAGDDGIERGADAVEADDLDLLGHVAVLHGLERAQGHLVVFAVDQVEVRVGLEDALGDALTLVADPVGLLLGDDLPVAALESVLEAAEAVVGVDAGCAEQDGDLAFVAQGGDDPFAEDFGGLVVVVADGRDEMGAVHRFELRFGHVEEVHGDTGLGAAFEEFVHGAEVADSGDGDGVEFLVDPGFDDALLFLDGLVTRRRLPQQFDSVAATAFDALLDELVEFRIGGGSDTYPQLLAFRSRRSELAYQ